MKDIDRNDQQNWTTTQRLCQSKVKSCLAQMRDIDYSRRERILETEYYLEITLTFFHYKENTKNLLGFMTNIGKKMH